MTTFYYQFVRICNWFAHFHYVVANSTGMNQEAVRRLRREWDYWQNELQVLEISRDC
jgi:hypothetical protein